MPVPKLGPRESVRTRLLGTGHLSICSLSRCVLIAYDVPGSVSEPQNSLLNKTDALSTSIPPSVYPSTCLSTQQAVNELLLLQDMLAELSNLSVTKPWLLPPSCLLSREEISNLHEYPGSEVEGELHCNTRADAGSGLLRAEQGLLPAGRDQEG